MGATVMATTDRIETERARTLRRGRRALAAPGGFHDRLVRVLGLGLPVLVGMLAAVMVLSPLLDHQDLSFLLDRNKAAPQEDRLSVESAMYRGSDKRGRPFSLTARRAVQRAATDDIVRLDSVRGRILLPEGPASVLADGGLYNLLTERLAVAGPLRVLANDGYRLTTRDVSIDFGEKTLRGDAGVSGQAPAGTFSADRLRADLPQRTVTLEGNARLRMLPGRME